MQMNILGLKKAIAQLNFGMTTSRKLKFSSALFCNICQRPLKGFSQPPFLLLNVLDNDMMNLQICLMNIKNVCEFFCGWKLEFKNMQYLGTFC